MIFISFKKIRLYNVLNIQSRLVFEDAVNKKNICLRFLLIVLYIIPFSFYNARFNFFNILKKITKTLQDKLFFLV